MKDLTNKKVYNKIDKEIQTVEEDFGNGELLFTNGILGRDDDIVVMEETTQYIQNHQQLLDEFYDLLENDKDFNYSNDEFIDWFFDTVLTDLN